MESTETTEVKKKRLPEIKVKFGDVNIGNINLLKCLNNDTLPVKYSKGFYDKMLGYSRYSLLGRIFSIYL